MDVYYLWYKSSVNLIKWWEWGITVGQACYVMGGGIVMEGLYTSTGSRPDNEISECSGVQCTSCIVYSSIQGIFIYEHTRRLSIFLSSCFLLTDRVSHFSCLFFFKLSASNSTDEKKSVVWEIIYTGRILIVQFDVIYLDIVKKM